LKSEFLRKNIFGLFCRYSVGNSKFTSRPPTGVDLALGLNGYDKLPAQFGPARAPSSLQPLEDLDVVDKCRRRMARRETEDIRLAFRFIIVDEWEVYLMFAHTKVASKKVK
jgi:hypothetical protein